MTDITATEIERREREIMPKRVAELIKAIEVINKEVESEMVRIFKKCAAEAGVKL